MQTTAQSLGVSNSHLTMDQNEEQMKSAVCHSISQLQYIKESINVLNLHKLFQKVNQDRMA